MNQTKANALISNEIVKIYFMINPKFPFSHWPHSVLVPCRPRSIVKSKVVGGEAGWALGEPSSGVHWRSRTPSRGDQITRQARPGLLERWSPTGEAPERGGGGVVQPCAPRRCTTHHCVHQFLRDAPIRWSLYTVEHTPLVSIIRVTWNKWGKGYDLMFLLKLFLPFSPFPNFQIGLSNQVKKTKSWQVLLTLRTL